MIEIKEFSEEDKKRLREETSEAEKFFRISEVLKDEENPSHDSK